MATTLASVEPTAAETATTGLGPVHRLALGLAATTGVVHLYLFVTDSWLPFLLAGAGFLGAVGLFLALPGYRRPLYVAGVLFTLAQVAAYLLVPMGPVWLAVLDKTVQVALVLALGYLFVADGARAAAGATGPAGSD